MGNQASINAGQAPERDVGLPPYLKGETIIIPMSTDFHFSSVYPKDLKALLEEWHLTKEEYTGLLMNADKIASDISIRYNVGLLVAHPIGNTSTAFTDALVRADRRGRDLAARLEVEGQLATLLAAYQLINPGVSLEVHGGSADSGPNTCQCGTDTVHLVAKKKGPTIPRVESLHSLASMNNIALPRTPTLTRGTSVRLHSILGAGGSSLIRPGPISAAAMLDISGQSALRSPLSRQTSVQSSTGSAGPSRLRHQRTDSSGTTGPLGSEDGLVVGEGEDSVKERDVDSTLERKKKNLKREVTVIKPSSVDFGVRWCRHRGWVYAAEVFPGTAGWRVGLQTGDRLEEIGDLPVSAQMRIQDVVELLLNESEVFVRVVDTPLRDFVKVIKVPGENGGFELICYHDDKTLSRIPAAGGPECLESLIPQGNTIVAINSKYCIGLAGIALWMRIQAKIEKKGKATVFFMPSPLVSELQFTIRSRLKREAGDGAAAGQFGGAVARGSISLF